MTPLNSPSMDAELLEVASTPRAPRHSKEVLGRTQHVSFGIEDGHK